MLYQDVPISHILQMVHVINEIKTIHNDDVFFEDPQLLVYTNDEPDEIQRLIDPYYVRNTLGYVQYQHLPVVLKYKINRNINALQKHTIYCDFDTVINPTWTKYTHSSGFYMQSTMCLQCGNYIYSGIPAFEFFFINNVHCLCSCKKYSLYVNSVVQLIQLYQTNILGSSLEKQLLNEIQEYHNYMHSMKCALEYSDDEGDEGDEVAGKSQITYISSVESFQDESV